MVGYWDWWLPDDFAKQVDAARTGVVRGASFERMARQADKNKQAYRAFPLLQPGVKGGFAFADTIFQVPTAYYLATYSGLHDTRLIAA